MSPTLDQLEDSQGLKPRIHCSFVLAAFMVAVCQIVKFRELVKMVFGKSLGSLPSFCSPHADEASLQLDTSSEIGRPSLDDQDEPGIFDYFP